MKTAELIPHGLGHAQEPPYRYGGFSYAYSTQQNSWLPLGAGWGSGRGAWGFALTQHGCPGKQGNGSAALHKDDMSPVTLNLFFKEAST